MFIATKLFPAPTLKEESVMTCDALMSCLRKSTLVQRTREVLAVLVVIDVTALVLLLLPAAGVDLGKLAEERNVGRFLNLLAGTDLGVQEEP